MAYDSLNSKTDRVTKLGNFSKFGNFPKFQSLQMFQSSCEKQFHILNTNFKIRKFKIPVSHLRLGWKFEPS